MTTPQPAFDPLERAALGRRAEEVRDRVWSASADPASVRIVAVTKGFGPDAVVAALGAGFTDIGENYADELVAKAAHLDATGVTTVPTWHFLGAVQRNKVVRLAPVARWWQGVSRLEEGRAIAARCPGATMLVQVDVAGIPGRGGCHPDQVAALVGALRYENLDVAGLMAVASPHAPDRARAEFSLVTRLADDLSLPVRSMGMSDDFEAALSEGSTMVRLGRCLFGPRTVRARPG
jgi:uncharacterized pyridoxal phosphate-containing UPF0001 family protein